MGYIDQYIAEENERRAKLSNDEQINLSPTHGWIYKTADELAHETMVDINRKYIRNHLKYFVERGWLSQRKNPHSKWDRTIQYRVDFDKIEADLETLGYDLPGYKKRSKLPATLGNPECDVTSHSNVMLGAMECDVTSHAIPEITTKINTESNTAGAREAHTANFNNLRSSAELPVNVKESALGSEKQPHNADYGNSGDVFGEDCEVRSGPHGKIVTPPTQSVNCLTNVNSSNTRLKNFMHQGENTVLDSLYQVANHEMIPTAWFNVATKKNIPTDKVNDVFGKFKHFYRGREYTKIDWNEKWSRWCDNERQFKSSACQEEKPIEVVVDRTEPAEVRGVRQHILSIVGDATYKSWYANCQIKVSSTNVEIIAPTKFHMTWIETNGKNLDSPLRSVIGKNIVYKHKQQNPTREARMAS
jgi:hypothetical protein